jgi:hypothetical protein
MLLYDMDPPREEEESTRAAAKYVLESLTQPFPKVPWIMPHLPEESCCEDVALAQ